MATLAIYGLGVALCILAALGLSGLLHPTGRWVGFATIPLGFCVLITLLYPLGAVMAGGGATTMIARMVQAAPPPAMTAPKG